MRKKMTALFMVFVLALMCLIPVNTAKADSVDGYLSLGEDLTAEELETVLNIFGIEDTEGYQISYITNENEHEYLDEYFSSSTIGTKALSCVLITPAEEGSGISVETTNISYCTISMYANALATAGVTDVDVKIAGPYSISGTAALIGAAFAYSQMSGEEVDEDAVDAAINEVVVTSELKESTEAEDEIEGVIAYVKEAYAEGEIDDVDETLDEAEEVFNVSLSEEDRELIRELIEKLDALDLDADTLAQQAQSVYESLSENGYDIDMDALTENITAVIEEQSNGFFAKLTNFFTNLFSGNAQSTDDSSDSSAEVDTDTDESSDASESSEVSDDSEADGIVEKIIDLINSIIG